LLISFSEMIFSLSNKDEKPAKVEDVSDEVKEPGKSEGLLND